MVTDFRHCKGPVIIVISFVSGRSCKYLYRLEGTPCKMSRCCPYPPPGYEKKAQVGLGLTHKKEKHKHEDKKRKRKRENETSGDSYGKREEATRQLRIHLFGVKQSFWLLLTFMHCLMWYHTDIHCSWSSSFCLVTDGSWPLHHQ